MKKILTVFAAAVFVFEICAGAIAQGSGPAADLAGIWQGTLHVGSGLRTVLKVTPDGIGGWKGQFYSIDQTPTPLPLDSITLKNGEVNFALSALHVQYHGTMSADGKLIKGTATQGAENPLDFERATPAAEWKIDASPHKAQFVAVEKDVKLEVLDWGGEGRPLILLAGLGSDAHDFDTFAPKLAGHYHVYGITRRGFGTSSVPTPTSENFSATRLGDDVLAVMEALKIERPVLVGHSIAGEELSSIGIRHPEKVAGLIYLDAGYPYAYYDPHGDKGDATVDWSIVRHDMDALFSPVAARARKATVKQLTETDLPRFQKDLEEMQKQFAQTPDTDPAPPDSSMVRSAAAVMRGVELHTGVQCPVLAFFAVPHNFSKMPWDAAKRAERTEQDKASTGAQADAFEKGNPHARVVQLPNADHFVFKSNESDVLREMDAFLAQLPK